MLSFSLINQSINQSVFISGSVHAHRTNSKKGKKEKNL